MQETTMFDQPETSPWGEIQRCVLICHGVYQVSTASHGGVMLTVRLARALLSSEARACGFQDGRYLCFEEDCQAAAVLLELLNKGLHKSPPMVCARSIPGSFGIDRKTVFSPILAIP